MDLAASYCPLGSACNPPLTTSAIYAASKRVIPTIHLTNLSTYDPSGKNIGNITDAMNKTVISGTPRQNSINPMHIYLIIFNSDLRPIANKTPNGKQNIMAKIEIMNVNAKPPHSVEGMYDKLKLPPANNVKAIKGNTKIRNNAKMLTKAHEKCKNQK